MSGTQGAQWVEIDAAARALQLRHGNRSVAAQTGKIGRLFRTAGGFAFRGTYGTAFRAPTIGELFPGQSDGFPLLEDPCDTTPPTRPGRSTAATAAECKKEGVPANFTSTRAAAREDRW